MRTFITRAVLFLTASLFFTASLQPLQAAGFPTEPTLRIETGMHTAMIRRIGIDRKNDYIVTSSDDKTVRVWNARTGELEQVLRPPHSPDAEGKLYSVAISPDGKTVVCGGWTGWNWDGYHSIYIFDRSTGKMTRRLTGHENVINHLVYSRDGKYLAATLGRNNGVRIYKTSDYSLVKADRSYGGDSYGADFDSKGRLVTASYDGFIRIYDKGFNLIAQKRGISGQYPFSVAISPDGSKVAVGYDDIYKVDVLDGKDLNYLFTPDSTGITKGDMAAVCWSLDGKNPYAGGKYWNSVLNSYAIRKWSAEGRGSYVDLPGSNDTVMQIVQTRYRGILYCSCDPLYGIYDSSDKRILLKEGYLADFRDNQAGFRVSRDGKTVEFAYEVWGKSPARFSVTQRFLELNPKADPGLESPVTSKGDISVTPWKNTPKPQINGRTLTLETYEIARSADISPDSSKVLIGADWHLYLFDRDGNQIWSISVPGAAWAVNITGDGNMAVACYSDGTIRWYRMSDGQEMLALFPHKDKKRWVIWSPKGYYDSSPGADEFIGWHKNNKKDSEADFYPLARFRSTFYRPDVIEKIFLTLNEDSAIDLANKVSGRKKEKVDIEKMLPPVVRIISPLDGTEVSASPVKVKFIIRSASGQPITGIKALIDGRPTNIPRGMKLEASGKIRELSIDIPKKDCEVSIIAENKFASSEPATVKLKWKGRTDSEEFIIKPKLYVLAIGVSKYKNKDLTLKYASKDATDFSNALKRQKGGIYRDVVIKLLVDENATKDNILDGLDWIRKETTSKDVAMVFLAGHGVNDSSGFYYFLPHNADTEKFMRTCLAFTDIKTTVASLAGKTLFFVDTCHSGNVMGGRRAVVDITGVVNELASAENGAVVFASSTGKQFSLEDSRWKNGAFTKALIEGLSGKADFTGKGKITINMLDLYISERVKELTNGKQTPTTTKPSTIPDFPVVVKK